MGGGVRESGVSGGEESASKEWGSSKTIHNRFFMEITNQRFLNTRHILAASLKCVRVAANDEGFG